MAWFLALQGSPNKGGQSPTYELQESADIERISQEMASSAALDRAVAIPALLSAGRQRVTLYVRPAAWGAWAFYELSDNERREMMAAASPLINAIAQARAAKPQQQAAPPTAPQPMVVPTPPPTAGPSVIPRLD